MGRVTTYTEEVAAKVLERLADGEGLATICRTKGMPHERTVRRWALENVEGFAPRYAQARAIGTERLADEILELSDDNARDVKVLEDGREVVDYEVVARSKLRVDSRKWLLSKLLPKTYGDKVTVDTTVTLQDLTDEQLAARLEAARQAADVGRAAGLGGDSEAGETP